jgi:taurine dioxygenase
VLGLCLYAMEVPESGTTTRFANASRAWQRLPESLRERIRGLTARHAFDLTTQRGDERYRFVDLPEREPRAVHPVAYPHPRTGTPVLYVSEMQTVRLLELDEAASDALLEELFAVLYAPDNVYEHRWQPGDLLLWDNLALQHARDPMPAEPRTLRRITLATKGVQDQVDTYTRRGRKLWR